MNYVIRDLKPSEYPPLLKEISDLPKNLRIVGTLPDNSYVFVTCIGARAHTEYGKSVCEKIIEELKEYKVVIVSGLAIGIDTVAHKKALEVGLPTIAVVGSGLNKEVLYPKTNLPLAETIIQKGGAVLSEYSDNSKPTKLSFPRRNRIMAGMSQLTIVFECENKSGTRITARLATNYNRDVAAVPGSIFSKMSEGPNNLISEGAYPISSGSDVAYILGMNLKKSI